MTQAEAPRLKHKQAAAILGMTPEALYTAYCRKRDWLPPRYKIGRSVRYVEAEVIACIKRVDPTAG